MKKTLLLFLFGLVAPIAVWAQGVVVKEPHQLLLGNTIIREVKYPATITCKNYSLKDSTLTFIYSDSTMTTKEASINGFQVSDMVVANDSVFFCGHDEYGKYGILGFFSISDVFFGSGSINIIPTILYYRELVTRLTRIETFRDATGNRYIYCVGRTESNNPCLVEKSDFSNGSYRSGIVNDSLEYLTDISIVNDGNGVSHLVSAGLDISNSPYITLRAYNPIDVFDNLGRQNYRYCFAIDPSGNRPWRLKDVLVTGLKDDYISTVSYRQSPANSDLTIEPFNIHIATFNTSSLLIGDLFSMTESAEIPIPPLYPNYNLRDLASCKTGLTLAFLHHISTGDWDGDLSHFFEVDFSATGGIVGLRKYQQSNDILSGLSAYNDKVQYLLSGKTGIFSSTLHYVVETFGNNETCSTPQEAEYIKVQTMGAIEEIKPFEQFQGDYRIITPEITRKRYPLYMECETK